MTDTIRTLTAQIVVAYVSSHDVATEALPDLVRSVHGAIADAGVAADAEKPVPAVPPRKSVFPDYIICLEDGKKVKLLRCYLKTAYNMTPQEYRERWGLPPGYPMVAPNYSQYRSKLSKHFGLGKKRQKGGVDEHPSS